MDHRRQSNWYKAGMGRGIANGRGGNPFQDRNSAKVSGNTEAQEFVASSPAQWEEEPGHGAARLPGGAREGNAAGMGNWGKSRGANAPASREVEKTLLRLVADNRVSRTRAGKRNVQLTLVSK